MSDYGRREREIKRYARELAQQAREGAKMVEADRAKLEVRNNEHAPRLAQIARANGLRWDPRATLAVTQWAYASAG